MRTHEYPLRTHCEPNRSFLLRTRVRPPSAQTQLPTPHEQAPCSTFQYISATWAVHWASICGGRTCKFIPVSTHRPTLPAQPARPTKDTILTSRQSKTSKRGETRDLRATKATLSTHVRNFPQVGITCDLPAMSDQVKRLLVITRSSNVIACFVLNLTQHNAAILVQGGGLTFHHQSKCIRMR